MEDCLFCKIVAGEIPCAKVYEDAHAFAFLDINPLTKGHCLVIPKKHFENIFDIETEVLKHIISVGKNVANKVKSTLAAVAVNLLNSNGGHAGQEVMHFHLHVIPRYEGDGVVLLNPRKGVQDMAELKGIAQLLT